MIARIQEYARCTHQPVPQTPGELAQATFASLALQYAHTADVLAECSGLSMPAIHIVGGGSQNAHLSQMTADVSGREVITGPIEATAIGNAIVQAIATGEIADIQTARAMIETSEASFGRYLPRTDELHTSRLADLHARYERLIKLEEAQ
jgi:rhamnulokinase